VFDADQRR